MKKFIKNTYLDLNNIVSFPQKRQRMKGCLIILNFHQVSETFNPAYHNKGTYTEMTTFNNLIKKIKKKYGFVSLEEGIKLFNNQLTSKNVYFCLTFDDGDITLKTHIIPFLQSENIPATLFINSKYLDNNTTSWVRAFNYLSSINHPILKGNIELSNSMPVLRNTNDPIKYNTYRNIIENTFSQMDIKPKFSIDYDFLKELDTKLFNIGLHGHEHQRYSMLTKDEQQADIEQNIKVLEYFPNYVPFWALPFGKQKDWDTNTIELAIEKKLFMLMHTNHANSSYNNLYYDRVPCDNKNFYSFISSLDF